MTACGCCSVSVQSLLSLLYSHSPVTEVGTDDEEILRISEVRREKLAVRSFLGSVDGPHEDGDDFDVHPDKAQGRLSQVSMVSSAFDCPDSPLKDLANIGQVHFYAMLILVLIKIHPIEASRPSLLLSLGFQFIHSLAVQGQAPQWRLVRLALG